MHFHVLTIFPDFFRSPLQASILGRGLTGGLVHVSLYDTREFTEDRHRMVDDYPFGGGSGMVMKPEPIIRGVEHIQERLSDLDTARPPRNYRVVSLTPQGAVLDQALVEVLTQYDDLILVCGHYEGMDERVSEVLDPLEISVGDYVLTGGEPAALILIDAISRLVPGVVGDAAGLVDDSHTWGVLQYPQYTRPRSFMGRQVPEILLSGNHAETRRWRREQALIRTLNRRPELLDRASLTDEDKAFLASLAKSIPSQFDEPTT